jgi:hypothetical protein
MTEEELDKVKYTLLSISGVNKTTLSEIPLKITLRPFSDIPLKELEYTSESEVAVSYGLAKVALEQNNNIGRLVHTSSWVHTGEWGIPCIFIKNIEPAIVLKYI